MKKKNKKYLVVSLDTMKEYRTKTIKAKYKNINQGVIYRIYEIKRAVGTICDGKYYKSNKEK